MAEYAAMLLSDHLAEALACLNRAREAVRDERNVHHRDIVAREITAAECSIARVLGLICGPANN
jgi:hypothetical protein